MAEDKELTDGIAVTPERRGKKEKDASKVKVKKDKTKGKTEGAERGEEATAASEASAAAADADDTLDAPKPEKAKKRVRTADAAAGAGADARKAEKEARKAAKRARSAFGAASGEVASGSSGYDKTQEAATTEEREAKRPRTRSMDAADKLHSPKKASTQTATVAVMALGVSDAGEKPEHPGLDEFDISEATKTVLRARGFQSLFPIQAMTYANIKAGKDLIGRARTGMGKTLAFALPIIERLLAADKSKAKDTGSPKAPRRAPRVLVMTPTRELARQVAEDFELTAPPPALATTCIYGGAPYRPQEDALRRGVDVVVGTPGRILDLYERGALRLSEVQALVLDEADQMLDMGFKEEMEKVFEGCGGGSGSGNTGGGSSAGSNGGGGEEEEGRPGSGSTGTGGRGKRQTLLFSATMPAWVQQVAKEYMSADKEYVDLVGDRSAKASQDVRHVAVPSHWASRGRTIGDVISVYGGGGSASRTIVFCTTKKDCNELVMAEGIPFECQPLHGDISQSNRESTLAGFKKGSFRVLVATDVAARGLDMIVDLVINAEPPTTASGRVDTETYVHRSGRTGRAGRKGCCVTLYTPKHRGALKEVEKQTGNVFEWRGAPQPADVIAASAEAAAEEIAAVPAEVVPLYEAAASRLIEERGALAALCGALACITGHKAPKQARSMLSNSEGFVTMRFTSQQPVDYVAYVWSALRKRLAPEVTDGVKGMQITADKMGAVFDVPLEHMEAVRALCDEADWLEVATELPPLAVREDEYRNSLQNRRGGAGGGRGGGFQRGGGRGGRGGGWGGSGGGSSRGGGRSGSRSGFRR